MLKIYLTRHGQDEDNAAGILNGHRDKPLTKLGVKQAHDTAKKIKEQGIEFDKIFTSPLQRVQMTAEIIAKQLGIEKPEVWDQLIERNFGVMTGVPLSEIENRCPPPFIYPDYGGVYFTDGVDGAETWDDLKLRAQKVIDTLTEKHRYEAILLVCHGDIGKMLYAAFYNISWQDAIQHFQMGNTELILLEEGREPANAKIITVDQHNA